MDLNWIKDLQRLADTGNFTQAAKFNNVSQSAFSRRIQSLEQWAGTSLVNRNSHPVLLTPAGEQLLEVGNQVVVHFDLVRSQFASRTQLDGPQITFAAQHAIGWRFYPYWLSKLENEYGSVNSRLLADNLPDCFTALIKQQADFVLGFESTEYRYISAQQSKIKRLIIGHDRLIPVCLAVEHGDPLISIKGKSIPFLGYGENAPLGNHLEPVLLRSKLKNKLSLKYENSMSEALRMRARNGEGIAWLPESLVIPDIENNLLTTVGPRSLIVKLNVCLYRYTNNKNEVVDGLWSYLQNRKA